MEGMEYKVGEIYAGFEKGITFEFTVNHVVDGLVFYIKRDDEDEEEVYGLEDLQKWTKDYYGYLNG